MTEFGSIAAVLAASPERLASQVGQDGAAVVQAVRSVMISALRPEIDRSDPLVSTEAVADYFAATVRHAPVEELHVLHLARGKTVIRHELAARGSRTGLLFEPREVLRRALELGSDAILLAHNHPSGDQTPKATADDIHATRQLGRMAGPLGIELVDHVVIGRGAVVSLRAEGLL